MAPGFIRKITTSSGQDIITTVAGNSNAGTYGTVGVATSIALYQPWGLTGDSVGNLFVAEYTGARVRKLVTSTGIISSFAGSYLGMLKLTIH